MRRLFVLTLAILMVCGIASAAVNSIPTPNSRAVIYQTATGSRINEPATVIVPCRLTKIGANVPGRISGDVVLWDTTSADAFSVTGPENAYTAGDERFAGVLVTAILSADSDATTGNERNWGWMAVKGYCLASIDAAVTVTGAVANLTVAVTGGFNSTSALGVSNDVGVLLKTMSAAGLAPVWLK